MLPRRDRNALFSAEQRGNNAPSSIPRVFTIWQSLITQSRVLRRNGATLYVNAAEMKIRVALSNVTFTLMRHNSHISRGDYVARNSTAMTDLWTIVPLKISPSISIYL